MSNFLIDSQYINILSGRLEKFTSPRRDMYNCRCPICGDSRNNPHKKRFYIRLDQGQWFTYCHNCLYNKPFGAFLRDFDSNLYDQYRIDSFEPENRRHSRKKRIENKFSCGEKRLPKKEENPKVEVKPKPKNTLPVVKVESLDKDHPVTKYLDSRLIPEPIRKTLFYTKDFKEFTEQFRPDVVKRLRKWDKRIIIPFYDENGKMFMFQGRTLNPDIKPKYITIKLDDNSPKVYGQHSINQDKPVRVVEGVLDSWFVHNCVATCDSNLTSYKTGDVYIWDNEPRSREITKKMESAIKEGKRLLIWPKTVRKFKDINAMVCGGLSVKQIDEIISKNAFQGGQALIRFHEWQKAG